MAFVEHGFKIGAAGEVNRYAATLEIAKDRMLRSRWIDGLWLLAFGIASSAWCVTSAAELGATFDEPLYLNAGLTGWRTGSNKLLMSAGTMPLPVDVETLPIYLWEQGRG